jgi:hypothetical protein
MPPIPLARASLTTSAPLFARDVGGMVPVKLVEKLKAG